MISTRGMNSQVAPIMDEQVGSTVRVYGLRETLRWWHGRRAPRASSRLCVRSTTSITKLPPAWLPPLKDTRPKLQFLCVQPGGNMMKEAPNGLKSGIMPSQDELLQGRECQSGLSGDPDR